jgi:hypothetical protein
VVQPLHHDHLNTPTWCALMLVAPARDWNVFKQIFADHWGEFTQAHPRYQTAYYEGLVTKMLGCGKPDKMGYLDDKLLPSTSNAVERGNRRYRKMQKQVYRVRTQGQINARLALDMWREAHTEGRQQTLASLHRARAG